MQKGTVKNEKEGLVLASQDKELTTNALKARIDKTQKDNKCRLCKYAEETVKNLRCRCKRIAQTDYLERHNKVATMIHFNLCKKYSFPIKRNWLDQK